MPDYPLTWRTYRDRSQAPVPVLQAKVVHNYRLRQRMQPEDEKLKVEPFEEAYGAFSDEEWTGQDWLPAKALGSEPVRIRPSENENLTTQWRLAEPEFERPDLYTHYDVPKLLPSEEAILVSEYRHRASEKKPTYRRAKSWGQGLFQISPGFRELQGVLVNGDPHAFSGYDYDPRHGMIYMEESWGNPMPADVNVEVFVDRSESMRMGLEHTDPGEIPVTVGHPKETVATLEHRRVRKMKDVRRLPSPNESDRWHAVDWAHYDGRPIPEGMMWIIHTDAPKSEVEEATDRVMPAGTLYRVKANVPEATNLGTDTEGDTTEISWAST